MQNPTNMSVNFGGDFLLTTPFGGDFLLTTRIILVKLFS